jgi:hypothetical protein
MYQTKPEKDASDLMTVMLNDVLPVQNFAFVRHSRKNVDSKKC